MIPFIKPILPSIKRCETKIQQIYEKRYFSNNGYFVKELEHGLQQFLKSQRDIVIVNNATIGLILALQALDIKKKVLVPSFTFIATIQAIEFCNLEYEFIDIDNYWTIDANIVENKIKTGEYDAIMAVNSLGNPCDIYKLEKLATDYNVKLIFDSASCISASYNNIPIGNFGDIEVFSLHATKCLPVGEGGFMSIKNKDIAKKIRRMKNFGFNEDRIAVDKGFNAKMPEILAIIGIEALKDLPQHIKNRQLYVGYYKDLLKNYVEFQKIRDNCQHGYQILSILVNDSELAIKKMEDNGIQLKKYYNPSAHCHLTCKKDILLPMTDYVSNHVISLPLYSVMEYETINIICKNLMF